MTPERYVWSGTRRLRCGYTTGSCAAMAAGVAARMLLGEPPPPAARLMTPSGVLVQADVEQAVLDSWDGAPAASCGVRKDAGDDVDATDGLLVCARVRRLPEGEAGAYDPRDLPVIDGGRGVGRVTLPGLDQPVGAAAINSVPRAMIAEQVRLACADHGREPLLQVEVYVPGGEEAASKTFNASLGVVGGISILGTSGIVEPMSVAALRDSIDLEISQRAAQGARGLVLVPGNYGEQFAATLPELAGIARVSCSNYVGHALDCCARHKVGRVLLVGHVGKLAKVAGGVMETHSRTADCRVEVICAHAACCGAPADLARRLMACATTDACLDELDRAGLLAPVCSSLGTALQARLEARAAGAFEVGAVMFSRARGELCRTPGVDGLARLMRADAGGAKG